MDQTEPKGVRISSSKHGLGEYSITLSNLTEKELAQIEGMMVGHYHVTVVEGRLQVHPTHERLPAPAEDTEMLPYWSRSDQREYSLVTKLIDTHAHWPPYSPSLLVQSLCGYNYTTAKYKRQTELLESYGFQCMRSHRGIDGKYWEIWFLPGFWAAKGKLGEATHGRDGREKKDALDVAISFLCENTSFGSLDVVCQRAAMTTDD